MNVLVVDDEKLIRDVIKEYLLLEKMEVTEAENGIEAIEKVKEGNFDIIIKEFTFNNNKYPSKSFNELYNDYIKISNDLIEIFKIFINNYK